VDQVDRYQQAGQGSNQLWSAAVPGGGQHRQQTSDGGGDNPRP